MKAIIMKHGQGGSYIYDRDGVFRFVRGYTSLPVGSEINVSRRSIIPRPQITTLAYMMLVIVCIGTFRWIWTTPSYSVYVDINPSVEVSFNLFGHMTSVRPLNADGEILLEGLSLHGSSDQVVIELVHAADELGYIVPHDTLPAVSVTVIGRSDEASQNHADIITSAIENQHLEGLVVVGPVNPEIVEEAAELDISPGKLELIARLLELDPTLEMQDVIDLSIIELVELIEAAELENAQQIKEPSTEEPLDGKETAPVQKATEPPE